MRLLSFATQRMQPPVDVRPFTTSLCAATLCAALTLGPPAHAAYLDQDFQDASQRVERSLISLADASYGILKSQTSETTSGYISAVIDVANGADGKELTSLVERGLDVALSLPVEETKGALKDAFAGLSKDTCQMVPLSRASIDQLLRPNTLASVDPAKRKASTERYAATLAEVPRTDMGVCLHTCTHACIHVSAQERCGCTLAERHRPWSSSRSTQHLPLIPEH